MEILIVDDSKQFRESLKDFLENKLNHHVIAKAKSGEEFLTMKEEMQMADVILMDIVMNKLDGVKATSKALDMYPTIKIIAVTMHIEKLFLVQLIETGFKGCVNKIDIWANLNEALNTVYSGSIYFPDDIKIIKKTMA
jgi:DNA-binding NarL/FixJ family response regulator